ncbi:GYD domain-containing protein [Natronococcus wangiae]|uniref:GYD domain-containing protein n=1 Tax=Natronococcus wangiae TaxID=3068275 RepID=UPI00273D54B3|nr:GYD domain-containing protein [Natronococcus sp. AD5]
MPTYISLIEWTRDGIENVTDSPDRLDDAKELAESFDGELTDFYLTFGEYDLVSVGEFPDDESYAQFVLTVASKGAVSTTTLKAFPEDEYREIIAGISG